MPERSLDPMLQAFVDVMNGAGVQLGITLLVGGSWLSGTLIPPRMFTEEFGDYVLAAAGENAASIQTFFKTIGRSWFPSESEREIMGGRTEAPAAAPHARWRPAVGRAGVRPAPAPTPPVGPRGPRPGP